MLSLLLKMKQEQLFYAMFTVRSLKMSFISVKSKLNFTDSSRYCLKGILHFFWK